MLNIIDLLQKFDVTKKHLHDRQQNNLIKIDKNWEKESNFRINKIYTVILDEREKAKEERRKERLIREEMAR